MKYIILRRTWKFTVSPSGANTANPMQHLAEGSTGTQPSRTKLVTLTNKVKTKKKKYGPQRSKYCYKLEKIAEFPLK